VLHAGVLQAAAVLHQLRELSNEAMDNALQVGWALLLLAASATPAIISGDYRRTTTTTTWISARTWA
jgi:hypothetical protein